MKKKIHTSFITAYNNNNNNKNCFEKDLKLLKIITLFDSVINSFTLLYNFNLNKISVIHLFLYD